MKSQTLFNTIALSASDRKYGTWLAYTHLFFHYVRPQEYIPGMSLIPTSGIISFIFAAWGALHFRPSILKSPIFAIFMLGFAYGLSAIDATNVKAHRLAFYTFVEVLPQCIALYILFDSRERVSNLYKLWCVIYFFMAIITISNGGRGPGSFTADENDVALALSMGLPLCFYAMWHPDMGKRFRYFSALTSLIVIAAIIVTASRGGFLGLVAVVLMLWWLSRKRVKVAAYAILASLVLSGLFFSILPANYLDEVRSINDTEDSTRVERFRLWETAWEMYKDNPVNGVGVGNQIFYMLEYSRKTSWYTGDDSSSKYQGKVVHSVYFQVISETGTVGAAVFFYIMFLLPLGLYRLRSSLAADDDDTRFLMLTVQTLIIAMGAYVISGAFISVAYYPHIAIWITMYAITMRLYLIKKKSEEKTVDGDAGEQQDESQSKRFKWDRKSI